MCRYCWDDVGTQRELFREWVGRTREERDDRDYEYPEREEKWEACPDYALLMERGDDVAEEEGEWEVWLEEGARRVPNG